MNIEQLKQEIRDNIRDNGKGSITGQILQDVLIDMASKIADAEEMAGKDGVGIARIESNPGPNNTTRVTVYLDNDDSTSFDIKNGKDGINGRDGRDGADGRNGADGINGLDGRPGADGRNGADGADGREGAQGKSGAQGPAGPSGSVTEGTQGPMGDKGSDGARGAQGPVGPAGGSSSGSQGPMGAKGSDGSRGAQGAKGPSGDSGAQGPAGDGADTELFERLEEELEEYKAAVSGRLESIRNDIESGAEEAVGEALSRLNLTADELANLRDRLNEAAQNAQNALDLARLMGSGGTIDPEVLADIMSRINGANDWINNYSGRVMTMWDEYNASLGYLGRAGIGVDPSKGMIGLLGENINIISGTVGTVQGEWDASKGRITQMATWYDESASTYANAIQEIDAMNARITNMVEYVCDSAITSCQEYVNGQIAEIGRIVAASGFSGIDLTYIEDKINAISGYAHTEIDRFHGMSGDLTTIVRDLNAADASLTTRITNTSAGLQTARDMLETWSQESGMLRTVSDLVIKKDSEGYPIFWYIASGQTGNTVEKTRVYHQGKDTSGKVYFTTAKNGTGTKYYDNVYPDYITGAFSFMNQKVNSIEMGVTSGDVLAALNLSVEDGTSRINLLADRVNIDADTFVRALSAETANIAGVKFGGGIICGGTPTGKHWKMDGQGNFEAENGTFRGTVYATDGEFKGVVRATELILEPGAEFNVTPEHVGIDTSLFVKLDSAVTGTQGETYISRQGLLRANNAIISGNVYATNSYLKGRIEAEEGYFRGSVSATNGYFNGEIIASAGTIGGLKISKNGISGANINITNNYFFSDNVGIQGSISADNGYFRGDIYARSLTLGSDAEEAFNRMVSGAPVMKMLSGGCVRLYDELGNRIDDVEGDFETLSLDLKSLSGKVDNWGITDMGDYVQLDHTIVSGNSAVTISKNGLLIARNAVVSGTVWATDGVFNGAVYADRGEFKGAVTATSGQFKGSISADNGYFKGTLCAATGTFGGKLTAAEGSFNGAVTATTLKLGNQTYSSMPSSLSSGDVRNIVGQEANSHGWITTGDGYYKINSPVGDNFKVDTDGLLVAKNAILSGGVYATNGVFSGTVYANDGKFKGNISADSGYFKGTLCAATGTFGGKLTAAEGSFKGAVSATSLYLGNQNITSIPSADGFLQLGREYNNIKVSTDGLLQANNAVIHGDIYAKNGNFAGTVSGAQIVASDIILNGKSLRLDDDTETAVEISNDEITIEYVPKTYTSQAYGDGPSYDIPYNYSAVTRGSLLVTGTTTVDIPSNTFTLSFSNGNQGYGWGCTAYTFVTSSNTAAVNPLMYQSQCVTVQTGYSQHQSNDTTGSLSIDCPAISNLSLKGDGGLGRSYYWGYGFDFGSVTVNVGYRQNSAPSKTVTVVPDTSGIENSKFVKIGRNGIQIFLGDSFYFTAARTEINGVVQPTISFGGMVNGDMKFFKLDKTGITLSQ